MKRTYESNSVPSNLTNEMQDLYFSRKVPRHLHIRDMQTGKMRFDTLAGISMQNSRQPLALPVPGYYCPTLFSGGIFQMRNAGTKPWNVRELERNIPEEICMWCRYANASHLMFEFLKRVAESDRGHLAYF